MRRLRAARDDGYTMVEMLIVVTIMMIVLSVLYRGLDSMQMATEGTKERLVNLEEARVMMATLSRDLRTAVRLNSGTSPFIIADAREMTFYANLQTTSGPNQVHIYVDSSNRLIEDVIAPGGTAPNYTYLTAPKRMAVSNYIVPSVAIFKYQYFNESTGLFVDLTSVPLSQTDRNKVESIEISIAIQAPSGLGTPSSTLENRVRLSNIYYNPTAAQ